MSNLVLSHNLNFANTAKDLNISPATLRNWIKQGVITSLSEKDINDFKKKLKNNQIDRLNSRANKFNNQQKNSHTELLTNKDNVKVMMTLCDQFLEHKKLFWLALYVYQLKKYKIINSNLNLLNSKIKKELLCWGINYKGSDFKNTLNIIEKSNLDFQDNLLGFAYQYSSLIGDKQKKGAYYTPTKVIQKILNSNISQLGHYFDPCCGAGNFIVEVYKHYQKCGFKNAHNWVGGCDLDLDAVLIARANLTCASRGKANSLEKIYCANYLTFDEGLNKYDYIFTNPPWGAELDDLAIQQLQQKNNLIKTKEIFSFFLLSAVQNLKKSARLSFVLPHSFLNVKAHAEIRREIFSKYKIESIVNIDEKFSGVLTSSIILNVTNELPAIDHSIKIYADKIFKIKLSMLLNDPSCTVSLSNCEEAQKILHLIELNSNASLKNNANWILGVVTGNNKKFISPKKLNGAIPVVAGQDISNYKIAKKLNYLVSDFSRFQQMSAIEKYQQKPKLLYRFISKNLVFAIDRQGLVSLNSANAVLPLLKNYNCEVLCAIFNSKLAQFYFQKKYNSFKVLRSHLEAFPLPCYNPVLFLELAQLVQQLEDNLTHQNILKIDKLVFQLYGLEAKQIEIIHRLTPQTQFFLHE